MFNVAFNNVDGKSPPRKRLSDILALKGANNNKVS